MEQIIENRAITGEAIKPTIAGRSLNGYWLVFDELSMPLMGKLGDRTVVFREKITKTALENTDFSNTKCCLNHDEANKFLGRVPNTLKIGKDDRGMLFSCELPALPIGDEVIEMTNRGDYSGNSFRFVTFSGDDTWERQADGSYIRTVNNIRAVLHLGPVFDPAYPQTDLNIAMRSLQESGVMEIEEEAAKGNYKAFRDRSLQINELEFLK